MMPSLESYTAVETLQQMDGQQLTHIVSRALSEPVTLAQWHVTLLGGLNSSPMAGGVYKLSGTAVTANHTPKKWCVVVKILRSPEGMTMPDGTYITREMAEDRNHFGYWQRERLVAESGLLDELPAGLTAPRFLGTTHQTETECWLWQTCLGADDKWKWAEYREAAYRLGQWQARGQAAHTDHTWLSQNWMAGWVHGPLAGIFGIVEGMNGYQHPLLSAHFAPKELDTVRQLWADRQSYLDRLADLPQTLCHLDAHRGNLCWQGEKLALFDWAFVGTGAVGEELAAFIGATLLLDYLSVDEAEKLEQAAFAGYTAGLRAAGWQGDEALIWEAYRLVLALRYAPASISSMLRTDLQPEFAAEWEAQTGKPLREILAHRAELVRFYLSRLPLEEQVV
ncbi:MAG: phosphotransferase [Anaerolineales bacterium]|nr:phosphotransferase [Anaerolineales bacterium]